MTDIHNPGEILGLIDWLFGIPFSITVFLGYQVGVLEDFRYASYGVHVCVRSTEIHESTK